MKSDLLLRILRAIPLLGFVLIAANLLALLGDGFDTALFRLPMLSDGEMELRSGDLVVLAGLCLLFAEVFKVVRTGASMIDHVGSLIVSAIVLVEFLFVERFAHAGILALLLMSLIDVAAGFTLTARRRAEGA